jgi:hypothetical protein
MSFNLRHLIWHQDGRRFIVFIYSQGQGIGCTFIIRQSNKTHEDNMICRIVFLDLLNWETK